MPDIVYEDNHLLVAVKPPNLLSQADDTGDPDLLSQVREYIRVTYHKPGAAYVGLVHRLDRPVGGLMAFAKTSKAAARLADQLRTHALGREYLCVVEGQPPEALTLTDYLLKDTARNLVRVVPEGTPGAKRAVLHATRLATAEGLSLCAIRLETGRSHQIRVQMANAGHPLWGDQRYGHGIPGQQIALWGYLLRLQHPTTKEVLCFTRLPQGGVWDKFSLSSVPPAADNAQVDTRR